MRGQGQGRRQGRRAGPALDRLRARLHRDRPLLRRLHRPPRRPRGGRVPALRAAPTCAPTPPAARLVLRDPAADDQAPRRPARCSAPTSTSTSARATAAPRATPATSPRTSAAARASCSASTRSASPRRKAAGRPTRSPTTTPSSAGRAATRSTPTACATPGASPSTAPPARSAIGDVGDDQLRGDRQPHRPQGPRGELRLDAFEGNQRRRRGLPRARRCRPIHAYPHGPGCSVIGGYVVRDPRLSRIAGREIVGRYIFGDFCIGQAVRLPSPPAEGRQGPQAPLQRPGPELVRRGRLRPHLHHLQAGRGLAPGGEAKRQ